MLYYIFVFIDNKTAAHMTVPAQKSTMAWKK